MVLYIYIYVYFFFFTGHTVVFGHQTGVSFEGHIILSSEDVRSNWLDVSNHKIR